MSKKGRRRQLANIEDSMDALIQGLEDYIKKQRKTNLITMVRNSTDSIMINKIATSKHKKKKNNYMDISKSKQVNSHTRRLGHGKERETLREKLNLFY